MPVTPIQGQTIWVVPSSKVVSQAQTSDRENLSVKQTIVSAIEVTSEALAGQLEGSVLLLGGALHNAAKKLNPTSIEMTFGLEVDAEANVLLGKLTGASNISVTLKWGTEDQKQ